MVAIAVASLGLGGLMTVNSYQLRVVHSSHEANIASLCMEERLEQMRIASWKQMTDAGYLRTNFYATAPKAGSGLNHVYEKIMVRAYPDRSVASPIMVTRTENQVPLAIGLGPDIAAQKAVRVDVYLTYEGVGGLSHTRHSCTVLTNGGVSRLTLPALGATASGSSATAGSTWTGGTSSGPAGNGRGNVAGEVGVR